RYSTEVVLQRYRGELTMLDGRGGGEGGGYADEAPAQEFAAAGGGRGAGAGRSERRPAVQDLDDEIPF
ncbi:MAG TPA: single-stranded DNA-binding protein, partial [Stellaceae bacterium]|nr:single-stranded DNA-binding protein [Stellaceae bacterium]